MKYKLLLGLVIGLLVVGSIGVVSAACTSTTKTFYCYYNTYSGAFSWREGSSPGALSSNCNTLNSCDTLCTESANGYYTGTLSTNFCTCSGCCGDGNVASNYGEECDRDDFGRYGTAPVDCSAVSIDFEGGGQVSCTSNCEIDKTSCKECDLSTYAHKCENSILKTCELDNNGNEYIKSTPCPDGCDSTTGACISCSDLDTDGYDACDGTGNPVLGCTNPCDCDDSTPAINPAVDEVCDDDVDNTCDGYIDCEYSGCASDPACTATTCIDNSDCTGVTPICSAGNCIACTTHPQCSQACSSECPAGVIGCCYGCGLGQCNTRTGECNCGEYKAYCSASPPYQKGVEAGNCDDKIDNDCDGVGDCDDLDCACTTKFACMSNNGGRCRNSYWEGFSWGTEANCRAARDLVRNYACSGYACSCQDITPQTCNPTSTRCSTTNTDFVETCNLAGTAWVEAATACQNGCDSTTGACKVATTCTDGTSVGTCKADGFYCADAGQPVTVDPSKCCPYGITPTGTGTNAYCSYVFCGDNMQNPAEGTVYDDAKVLGIDSNYDSNNGAGSGKIRWTYYSNSASSGDGSKKLGSIGCYCNSDYKSDTSIIGQEKCIVSGETPPSAGNDLVAWWKFDEGAESIAEDNVSNTHHGVIKGTVSWEASDCISGNCLRFDGDALSYVEVPHSPNLFPTEAFTISAWVKPSDFSAYRTIIQKCYPGFYWQTTDNNRNTFVNYYSNNNYEGLAPTTDLSPDTWYNIVLTFDKAKGKMIAYYNGIATESKTITHSIGANTNPLQIGGFDGGNMFKGLIDEVKIYNYARTAQQVCEDNPDTYWDSGMIGTNGECKPIEINCSKYTGSASCNLGDANIISGTKCCCSNGVITNSETFKDECKSSPPPSAEPKLVAHWSFNTESDLGKDDSGKGHTGTVSGAAWVKLANGGAARFEKNGDIITIPDKEELRLNGPFTIAFWYKLNEFVDNTIYPNQIYPGIIYKGNSAAAETGYILFYTPNGDIHYKRNGQHLSATGVVTKEWKYYVFAYTGSGWKWYVNGAEVNSGAATFISNTDTSDLILGRGDSGQYGKGTLDEVKIYNYALNPTQVKAEYDSYKPEELPIAHWSFDDETNLGKDESGNNNGIVNGATWVELVKGGAAKFDGVNDYINCGKNLPGLGGNNPFTFSAWVYPEKEGFIVSRYNGDIAGEFWFGIHAAGKIILGREAKPWGMHSVPALEFSEKWQHVAATYNSANASIYIDGKVVDSNICISQNSTKCSIAGEREEVIAKSVPYSGSSESAPTVDVLIGAWLASSAPTAFFNGSLDEVKIYNYALTESEISVLASEKPVEAACSKGETKCEGDTLKTCNAGKTGWDEKTCEKGCKAGACRTTAVEKKLISYWKFEGDAKDSAGTNHGNVTGATLTKGVLGKAYEFNGINNSIDCGNDSSLDITDEKTIEFWVKPDELQYTGLITKALTDSAEGINGAGYTIIIHNATGVGYRLTIQDVDAYKGYKGSNQDNLEFYKRYASVQTGQTPATEWSHVAFTIKLGNELKVYLNGDLKNTVTLQNYNFTSLANSNSLKIGKFTANKYFKGVMDEVAIHSYALSPEDIKKHYENGLLCQDYFYNGTENICGLVADAGLDRTGKKAVIVNNPVTLNGTGSKVSSGDIKYKWDIISKPKDSAITLSGPTTATPTFTPDKTGTYVFNLTVQSSLNEQETAVDEVKVEAEDGSPHAVINLLGTDPLKTITFSAKGSYDLDGSITKYIWYLDDHTTEPWGFLKLAGNSLMCIPAEEIDEDEPAGGCIIESMDKISDYALVEGDINYEKLGNPCACAGEDYIYPESVVETALSYSLNKYPNKNACTDFGKTDTECNIMLTVEDNSSKRGIDTYKLDLVKEIQIADTNQTNQTNQTDEGECTDYFSNSKSCSTAKLPNTGSIRCCCNAGYTMVVDQATRKWTCKLGSCDKYYTNAKDCNGTTAGQIGKTDCCCDVGYEPKDIASTEKITNRNIQICEKKSGATIPTTPTATQPSTSTGTGAPSTQAGTQAGQQPSAYARAGGADSGYITPAEEKKEMTIWIIAALIMGTVVTILIFFLSKKGIIKLPFLHNKDEDFEKELTAHREHAIQRSRPGFQPLQRSQEPSSEHILKQQSEIGRLAERHQISPTAEDQVTKYIQSCKSRGFTDDQIKDALLKRGWKEEQIAHYFV